mmetsp:Transcript_6213/g.17513  ORF Transcript_6213/g.17513 Transcript_6213/m.17513 type:complete len:241 (+) Transcript_6213:242-964(+)
MTRASGSCRRPRSLSSSSTSCAALAGQPWPSMAASTAVARLGVLAPMNSPDLVSRDASAGIPPESWLALLREWIRCSMRCRQACMQCLLQSASKMLLAVAPMLRSVVSPCASQSSSAPWSVKVFGHSRASAGSSSSVTHRCRTDFASSHRSSLFSCSSSPTRREYHTRSSWLCSYNFWRRRWRSSLEAPCLELFAKSARGLAASSVQATLHMSPSESLEVPDEREAARPPPDGAIGMRPP